MQNGHSLEDLHGTASSFYRVSSIRVELSWLKRREGKKVQSKQVH